MIFRLSLLIFVSAVFIWTWPSKQRKYEHYQKNKRISPRGHKINSFIQWGMASTSFLFVLTLAVALFNSSYEWLNFTVMMIWMLFNVLDTGVDYIMIKFDSQEAEETPKKGINDDKPAED